MPAFIDAVRLGSFDRPFQYDVLPSALAEYGGNSGVVDAIATETESGALQAVERFLKRGARNALITLGAKGRLLNGEASTHLIPAFSIPNVVDTTGAGDAFNVDSRWRLPKAVRRRMRSVSVRRPQSFRSKSQVPPHSMPTRAEIDRFVADGS